jgi:hypothetical protein
VVYPDEREANVAFDARRGRVRNPVIGIDLIYAGCVEGERIAETEDAITTHRKVRCSMHGFLAIELGRRERGGLVCGTSW